MPTVITINGATPKDEVLRSDAMSALNDLPTEVMVKLAKLSQSEKAQSYFKNPILFATLQGFLRK